MTTLPARCRNTNDELRNPVWRLRATDPPVGRGVFLRLAAHAGALRHGAPGPRGEHRNLDAGARGGPDVLDTAHRRRAARAAPERPDAGVRPRAAERAAGRAHRGGTTAGSIGAANGAAGATGGDRGGQRRCGDRVRLSAAGTRTTTSRGSTTRGAGGASAAGRAGRSVTGVSSGSGEFNGGGGTPSAGFGVPTTIQAPVGSCTRCAVSRDGIMPSSRAASASAGGACASSTSRSRASFCWARA